MYAIVKTGGKQYRAQKEEVITVDLIEGNEGDAVEFEEVVFVQSDGSIKVGSPYVKGAKVKGVIHRQVKGEKINAFNYKAKKNERKRWGHRQPMTQILVKEVVAGK